MTKTASATLLFLAAESAGVCAQAPATGSAAPAPIVRTNGNVPRITSTQPVNGVWVRTDAQSQVQTVSANAGGTTELRVEHGRANIQVHKPADQSEILVDLPGGQTSLIKDGLYTFNAETDTVTVLHGEADAYAAGNSAKPVKVKEAHQFSFNAQDGHNKPVEVDPRQLTADLLPGGIGEPGQGMRGGSGYGYGYAPGPYGDGFYPYSYGPYPYMAYWGDPFYPAWGYPYPYGFGLGFNYFGGFRGGYIRGRR